MSYTITITNVVYSKKNGTKNVRVKIPESFKTFEEADHYVFKHYIPLPPKQWNQVNKTRWAISIKGFLYPGTATINLTKNKEITK